MKKHVIAPLLLFTAGILTQCFIKADYRNEKRVTIESGPKMAAPKPLFRDPVHDGAADPVVVYSKPHARWLMFYTNRRANVQNTSGVEWVHGSRIGIAESQDGLLWRYRDTADINFRPVSDYTHWAPEVIGHDGIFHMYLTFVPGVFQDWSHARDIIHLTSKNLTDWKYESTLELSSKKVIDACVFQMENGTWRMWYNNEADDKSIYYADSPDLYQWEDKGKALGDRPGEGPVVFRWKDAYWMIVDVWRGLGVYSSDDLEIWLRQEENLVEHPGTGLDDQVKGGHADVVVNGDKAFLYYFTHPGRYMSGEGCDGYAQRRSAIQVTELKYENGKLICDRNREVDAKLDPSFDKKGRNEDS